jgi:hypothetical protein
MNLNCSKTKHFLKNKTRYALVPFYLFSPKHNSPSDLNFAKTVFSTLVLFRIHPNTESDTEKHVWFRSPTMGGRQAAH